MASKEYEMTEEQYEVMITRPLPIMLIGGVDTRDINQMSANIKWRALGDELGFVWHSARPICGKGPRWFRAEEKPDEPQ